MIYLFISSASLLPISFSFFCGRICMDVSRNYISYRYHNTILLYKWVDEWESHDWLGWVGQGGADLESCVSSISFKSEKQDITFSSAGIK